MKTPEEIIAEIESAVSEFKGKISTAQTPSERAIAAQMLRLKTAVATAGDDPAPVEAPISDPAIPESGKLDSGFWDSCGTFAALRDALGLGKRKPAPVEPSTAPVED